MLTVRACSEEDVDVLERDLPTGAARIHASHWLASRSGRSTYLTAWVGGVARGVAVVNWQGPTGREAAEAFPAIPEIAHLQVAPSARGQGVGTRLIETAETMAEAAGHSSIAIAASVENVSARRLYERLGYRRTDVLEVSTYVYVEPEGNKQPMSETNTLLLKPLGGTPLPVGDPYPSYQPPTEPGSRSPIDSRHVTRT